MVKILRSSVSRVSRNRFFGAVLLTLPAISLFSAPHAVLPITLCLLSTVYFSARFLRYLCSNHVYKEVSPDVFANNRISSLIDTGKSIEELREKYVFSPVSRMVPI